MGFVKSTHSIVICNSKANHLQLKSELLALDSSHTIHGRPNICQLHKRFDDEQIKLVLRAYCHGLLPRAEVQDILSIGKTRLFELLNQYRQDPESFSVVYKRTARSRLSTAEETEIERALLQEKELVEDKRLPISGYNYSAIRDCLAKKGLLFAGSASSRHILVLLQPFEPHMSETWLTLVEWVDSPVN